MVYDYYKVDNLKKFKGKIIVAAFAVLAVIALIIGYNIYLEVAQLKEIGNLESVYYKNLLYKVIFSIAAFVVIFIAVSVTNIFVKKNMKNYMRENSIQVRRMPNFLISVILGLVGALLCKDYFYQKALNFLNAADFHSSTPLFSGKDIGYFVFQRPFFMSIYQFLTTLWVAIIIYTVVYYLIMFLLMFTDQLNVSDFKVKSILRHNLINIAIFFVIKAVSYKFQSEGLVYSNFLGLKGAGYVDVNVWMNYFKIAPFLLIAIVIVAMVFIWMGRLKRAAITIGVFPAAWIIVTITALVMQGLVVKPNEANLEKPYIKNNMQQTRLAFGLDQIASKQFPVKDLTPEIVNRNLDTIDNTRIVDYLSTLRSDVQLQGIKNFYTFNSGDIINYDVNKKDTPIFITAREVDKSKLQNQSYITNTFKYTHGYGVVINQINKVTKEGQADFLLGGLEMKKEGLNIEQPRIYYGELTNNYVIVNSENSGKLKEVDYDGSTETNYSGKGGIKLGWLDRCLFALKYGDINMIISGNVSSDSRLLLNRQVVERAQKAVPFLTVDPDPYIIITSDGRLEWVLDAYTTTNDFPYSQNSEDYSDFNYIRNSVKITVDAYNGTVKYYIIDEKDPLIRAYKKMYPEIFSKDPLPADVTNHMRYPETLFKIQTDMMKKYHLDPLDKKAGDDNVARFYTNEDMWSIAKYPDNANSGSVIDIEPYYNMIKLPGDDGKKEELILMRPFTPSGDKHNMVSWLAVRNSTKNENYGKMILYKFPDNNNILGPDQVEKSINTIPQISELMTLWGKNGSRVYKGSLLVIPIESSVLYVEPLYIEAEGNSSIPQVKKIIVGYQQGSDFKHGVGDTLDAALNDLFTGLSVTPAKSSTTETPTTTVSQDTQTPLTPDKQKTIDEIKAKIDAMKKQLDDMNTSLDELLK